ncbi:MAG: DUF429 domain-containing protein, partial [Oscillatoriales cyanobacterium SM2_2_1]|nr:DUF429 domain-containing protein [Oscillatoriales cyanobacterium SM2_2_1]
MKFLGIDLGWQSGASGLCCLGSDPEAPQRLHLLDCDRRTDTEEILAWVDACLPGDEPGAIAVDAPTLIPNATGMRLPDRLMHKHMGRYHAGCYPANLGRPFAQRTVAFGLNLEARGFRHAPEIQPRQPGRYQMEVFPHAASVRLFGLERILKYKKGAIAQRRVELGKFYQYLLDKLPLLEPSLDLATDEKSEGGGGLGRGSGRIQNEQLKIKNSSPPLPLPSSLPERGADLKALEDCLDACLCAYVAA